MTNANQKLNRKAWQNYWTDGRASGAIGCLPDATPEIELLQKEFWESSLGKLRRKAKIVDLATGDGSVLRLIHGIRKDFKLIGIDYSSELPATPKHIKLHANVDMEDMPFAKKSVSAFVSRFGIEYGNVDNIAREIMRTLMPQGSFAFLMHHSDSPIHAINEARAEQLTWALDDQKVIAKSEAFLRSRQQLGSFVPSGFENSVNLAIEKFGRQSVATEFCQAVVQTLAGGLDKPVALCLSIIGQLNNHSRQETRRIHAMIAASKDDVGMRVFEGQLEANELHVLNRFPLMLESEGKPIGWAINGQKSA